LEEELPASAPGTGLASVGIGNAAPPIGAKMNVNATATAKAC